MTIDQFIKRTKLVDKSGLNPTSSFFWLDVRTCYWVHYIYTNQRCVSICTRYSLLRHVLSCGGCSQGESLQTRKAGEKIQSTRLVQQLHPQQHRIVVRVVGAEENSIELEYTALIHGRRVLNLSFKGFWTTHGSSKSWTREIRRVKAYGCWKTKNFGARVSYRYNHPSEA